MVGGARNQSNSIMKPHLPFKVGQYAEAKCFSTGFRGAWFRCKIRNINVTDERMKLYLEYYDFPDEKMEWKKLYSKRHRYDTKEHLMVRPRYPPVNCEGELLDTTNDSEIVVVVNDVWKEGDLVDWWRDGCYWSGKLTKKLTKKTFQIELLPEPDGEGSSYEADCKDLRPSLVWSPEHGWTLPTPEGGKSVSPCARLVHPKAHQVHSADKGRTSNPVTTEVREEYRLPKSSTNKEGYLSRLITDQSRGKSDGKDHLINEGPSKLAKIHPVEDGREGNQVAPKAQLEHKTSSSNTSKGGCPSSFLKDPQGSTASKHDKKNHHLLDELSSKRARSEGNQVAPRAQPEHKVSTFGTSKKGCPGSFLKDPQGSTASNHNRKDHHLVDEHSSKRARSEGNQVTPAQSEHKVSTCGTSKRGCPDSFPNDLQGVITSNHDGKDHHLVDMPLSKRARTEGNQVAPKPQPELKPSSSGTSKAGCPNSFPNDPQLGTTSNHDGKDCHLADEPSSKRATSEGNQVAPVAQTGHKPSNSGTGKGGCPSSFPDLQLGTASNHDGSSTSKRATTEVMAPNSTNLDTFDASILELEELLGRVKWIKSLLQDGSSPEWTYI